ncbi:MAG: 50S ribosomal protein L25 [Lentisphaerae bacterium ADurb.Bin242]|nr:MAG: 50S ribosomal protein L25 [Lentisphaerae bacterium ADurb.Bin242]
MAKQKHVLNVVTRSETGKRAVKRLRAAGHIPAVVYGKGAPAKTFYFAAAEWEMLQKFELNLISLKEGENEVLALVKEVQNDFIRGKVKHVDFLEIRRDEVIRTVVRVHPGHTAPAGASMGGILEQAIHEIEVECLPDALPETLEVDVSALQLGGSLHIGELPMPEGVKAISDPELVVFHVMDTSKVVEEEAAASTEEAPAEPEVVGAKEKAEKAAAAAAAAGEDSKKKPEESKKK